MHAGQSRSKLSIRKSLHAVSTSGWCLWWRPRASPLARTPQRIGAHRRSARRSGWRACQWSNARAPLTSGVSSPSTNRSRIGCRIPRASRVPALTLQQPGELVPICSPGPYGTALVGEGERTPEESFGAVPRRRRPATLDPAPATTGAWRSPRRSLPRCHPARRERQPHRRSDPPAATGRPGRCRPRWRTPPSREPSSLPARARVRRDRVRTSPASPAPRPR